MSGSRLWDLSSVPSCPFTSHNPERWLQRAPMAFYLPQLQAVVPWLLLPQEHGAADPWIKATGGYKHGPTWAGIRAPSHREPS